MKKKLLYCLTALLAFGAVSCKDDDEVMGPVDPSKDFDRMPMTQYRQKETTGKDDATDDWASKVLDDVPNSIQLYWYGIEGAGGYEIKYGPHAGLASGTDEVWNNPALLTDHFVVGPEVQHLVLENLSYDQTYLFAIRVLHPDYVERDPRTGEVTGVIESEKHSKWYGMGTQREWARFLRLTTRSRYATPAILSLEPITRGETEITVNIDLSVKRAAEKYILSKDFSSLDEAFNDFKQHFKFVPGTDGSVETALFYFDKLTVVPNVKTPAGTVDNSTVMINPSDYIATDGVASFKFTGLTSNCYYDIDIENTQQEAEGVAKADRLAQTLSRAVWGMPGEPILIRHTVRATDSVPGEVKFQACKLDDIYSNYLTDPKFAEGQVFYLQGNCAYYFFNNPLITKGFVLETDPEDVKQGKRAKVYMGGIGYGLNDNGTPTADIATCNFMFGKQKEAGEADAPIVVGDVVFRNIDFDAPLAETFGDKAGKANGSGNYFANMYSDGMAVTFENFEIDNCTFQRMVRGFIRVQGNKMKYFEHINIKNCVMYNCGYYDANGRGYAWFAGDGVQATGANIYKDLQFVNNTIYDSPRTAFITDNDKNIQYTGGPWHIRIEGNTFINFSTRTSGRNFFQTRYIPTGSHYIFKRNLLVLAAQDDDDRALNMTAADIRQTQGGDEFSFEIADNYSLGCRDAHMKDDGIFNSGNSFTRTSNSFGATKWDKPGLVDADGNKLDTKTMVIKVLTDDNGNMMKATDLFNNVTPTYKQVAGSNLPTDHKAPDNIFEALRYKTVPSLIIQKDLGDPRWR